MTQRREFVHLFGVLTVLFLLFSIGCVSPAFAQFHVYASHYQADTKPETGTFEVALPSIPLKRAGQYDLTNAYWVKIISVANPNRAVNIPIREVGPWNHWDDYWNPSDIRVMFNGNIFPDLGQGQPESHWVYGDPGTKANAHPDYPLEHPGQRFVGNRDPRQFPEDLNDDKCWQSVKNPAGIDLGEEAFAALGSQDGWVDFSFSEPPMVKKVVITQDSTVIYDSQAKITHPAGIGKITIKIIFNETMKTTNLPVVSPVVSFGKATPYNQHVFVNGFWLQTNYKDDTWTGAFDISPSQGSEFDGENRVAIYAEDLGNLQIDNDEKSVAYNPGIDQVHRFQISTSNIYTMDFEDGTDRAVIQSRIPGLYFTTTEGYDWIYGDRRTGQYNIPPYGDGAYECNGNFFAWLGENQGMGRIDFTGATTKRVSFAYSSKEIMYLEAYDKAGDLIDSDSGSGNLNTGRLDRLSVTGANIHHILVHDSGNFWLVDDLIVEDLLRDTAAKYLPSDFERALEILNTINIGSPVQTPFINSAIQLLKIILNWGGSEMKLEVYKPDGTLYGQWQSSTPPIIVDIPNIETGGWKFVITAIDIPYEDYPYALVIGTKSLNLAIALYEGWNLISYSTQPTNNSVGKVLEPISGKYNSIFAYNTQTNSWQYYIITDGVPIISDLITIDSNKGYWINMKEDATLTIAESPPTDLSIPLLLGWNLVGYKGTNGKLRSEAIASIYQNCQSMFAYNTLSNNWQYYINTGGSQIVDDLDNMYHGKGYWINTSSDCVWDPNSSPAAPMKFNWAKQTIPRPEMPYIAYGNVEVDGVKVKKGFGHIPSIMLKVDGKIISTYRMLSNEGYGEYYTFEIPITDNANKIELYVELDGDIVKAGELPIGLPGKVAKYDLLYRRIPKESRLLQNYPNPFNPETWIPYQLSEAGKVTISIYDINGRLVKKLDMGQKEAGIYTGKERAAYWDGKNEAGEQVSSGVYFYRIQSGNFSSIMKSVMLK